MSLHGKLARVRLVEPALLQVGGVSKLLARCSSVFRRKITEVGTASTGRSSRVEDKEARK